jgi:hypothetical protein
MAKKCVHKGCGKTYDDDNEECVYHPGPPKFHEGQKGRSAQPSTRRVRQEHVDMTMQAGNAASLAS